MLSKQIEFTKPQNIHLIKPLDHTIGYNAQHYELIFSLFDQINPQIKEIIVKKMEGLKALQNSSAELQLRWSSELGMDTVEYLTNVSRVYGARLKGNLDIGRGLKYWPD